MRSEEEGKREQRGSCLPRVVSFCSIHFRSYVCSFRFPNSVSMPQKKTSTACAAVFPPVYPWNHRTSASCAEWETRASRRTAGNRPPFEGFNKERVGVHAYLGYPRAMVHRQFRSLSHRPLDPSNLGPLDPWILRRLVAFDQGRSHMVMPWWNLLNSMKASQVHLTWWIFQHRKSMIFGYWKRGAQRRLAPITKKSTS